MRNIRETLIFSAFYRDRLISWLRFWAEIWGNWLSSTPSKSIPCTDFFVSANGFFILWVVLAKSLQPLSFFLPSNQLIFNSYMSFLQNISRIWLLPLPHDKWINSRRSPYVHQPIWIISHLLWSCHFSYKTLK